jgi:hypothetical protein
MFDTNDFNFDIDPFEPIRFGSKSIQRHTIVCFEFGIDFGDVVGFVGDLISDDDNTSQSETTSTALVQDRTTSGTAINDMDFIFNVEFSDMMKGLADQFVEWGGDDRTFYEDFVVPYQAALMSSNQEILSYITANSTESLDQNLKDLLGSEQMKEAFRGTISDLGEDIAGFAKSFTEQIANIPTAEQRVGEVVSGIEQRFGQAGAELKKQMGAKGLDVSEAGLRQMALGKATALAGGVDAAQEASRKEQLAGATGALGVLGEVQTSQANLLTAERELTQSGALLTPSVSGAQEFDSTSTATGLGADLVAGGANKLIGTETRTDDAEFVQAGINQPIFLNDRGEEVDSSGLPITPDGPPGSIDTTGTVSTDDGTTPTGGEVVIDPVTGNEIDTGMPGDSTGDDPGSGVGLVDTHPQQTNTIENFVKDNIYKFMPPPLNLLMKEVITHSDLGTHGDVSGGVVGPGVADSNTGMMDKGGHVGPDPGSSVSPAPAPGAIGPGPTGPNIGADHGEQGLTGSGLSGRELAEFIARAKQAETDGGSSSGGNVSGISGMSGQDGDPPGTAGGGVRCFIAGTKIRTPDGSINIEDIVAGQDVLSFDLHSNKIVVSSVGKLTSTERSEYYEILFESGKILGITNDHPLYTENGWESVDPAVTLGIEEYRHVDLIGRLNAGSYVFTDSDSIDLIKSITPVLGSVTTYTLHGITPSKNFFAEGYLASDTIKGDEV